MIVTQTPWIRTESLQPVFFNHSSCVHCGRDIYVRAYGDDFGQGWSHSSNESIFCGEDLVRAQPVYGPLNLEIYWMNA